MENNNHSLAEKVMKKQATQSSASSYPSSQAATTQHDNTNKNSLQNLAVFLRGVTWMRDSHGLFDYESRSINKKSLKTTTQGKIVRFNNDIEFLPLNKNVCDVGPEAQALLQIKNTISGYALDHSENCSADEDSTDRLWLVIRSLKSPEGKYDYKINKFDVIKLGRVKFRIKDFACEVMGQSPEELYRQDLKEARPCIKLDPTQHDQNGAACRFCWSSDSTDENPCIVPCKCSGSVGFIHYFCLKSWLDTKMQKKETGHLLSMFWKTFECEICKSAYPYLFKVDNNVYKLVTIQQPSSGHFMVMESLPLEKNTSRTIHVLNFSEEKQTFNMGRGHESEVRVNDISVSRCHAIIKYQKDGIYIEDNKSKFGTLVLLKEQFPLQLEYTSAVQVGRTVISFTVRNTAIDKHHYQELPISNPSKVMTVPQHLFAVQMSASSESKSHVAQQNDCIDNYNKDDEDAEMEIDDN